MTSDARGFARTRWTLGTVAADSQVVEARAEGVPSLRLRAHARPDAPAALTPTGGGAVGPVGTALADSLAVAVKDRFGNPVGGVEVDWEVTAGGGTVSPLRTLTGEDGTARAQWTLGLRVDSAQGLRARIAGLEPAAFTAHAVTAGVPLQLAKRGGDGQRGPAGGVLAEPLEVVLRMPDGRPVVGALVAWSAPAEAGTVTPAVSRTDADGAASAAWRLGTAAGLARATARVDEGTLVFTALAEAELPADIAIVRGDGGEGPIGSALADSLAVRVRDRYGNPVAGAEVAWEALEGGGSLQPARSLTDAVGIARAQWTLGLFAGAPGQTASAALGGLPPVRFHGVATTRGVPLQLVRAGGDGQTGEVAHVLEEMLAIELRTQTGAPVEGASVAWAVTAGGGQVSPPTTRTDAKGHARTAWTMGASTRPARATARVDEGVLTFSAIPRAGPPASVRVFSGDGQSATRGTILADSLVARVTDAYGNGVHGALVRWSVRTGGGHLERPASTTRANGTVRTRWAVGFTPGENTVDAAVDGLAPRASRPPGCRGCSRSTARTGSAFHARARSPTGRCPTSSPG